MPAFVSRIIICSYPYGFSFWFSIGLPMTYAAVIVSSPPNVFESRIVASYAVVRLWVTRSIIFQLAVFGFGWCGFVSVGTYSSWSF